MFHKKSLIFALSIALAFPLFVASTSASADKLEPTYRAIVKGGSDGLPRLKLFHERLLVLLGVTNLAEADVGCDKCEKLNSGPPEDALVFYLPQRTLTALAFTLSWSHVQTAGVASDFTLQLDAESPPSPACSDHGVNCKPRAACEITDFCDNPKGGLCNAC